MSSEMPMEHVADIGVKARMEQDAVTHQRLLEAFETAPLEKLYAINTQLTSELERLGTELVDLSQKATEDPDSLELKLAIIDNKERTSIAISRQADLQAVLQRRQHEGKPDTEILN